MRASFRLLCLCTVLAGPALAQADEPRAPLQGTLIDLTADSQQTAPNDLGRATIFVEMQDASPSELARRVNQTVSGVLAITARYPAIKTRSGDTSTYPVYGKNNRIDAWRMRSDVQVESRDIPALGELLGKVQGLAMVGEMQLQPAPDTRKRAEDEAIQEALNAFRARAKLIADQLGKPYRISHLSVSTGSRGPRVPPVMMQRSAAMMSEAAPAPIAAGDSVVTVVVSGKIELAK